MPEKGVENVVLARYLVLPANTGNNDATVKSSPANRLRRIEWRRKNDFSTKLTT